MPPAKSTPSRAVKSRLYNLYPYNRFRLELPTGKKTDRNGSDVPVLEVFWIVGQQDASQETPNYVTLSSDQVKHVLANTALVGLIRDGKLNLVPESQVV